LKNTLTTQSPRQKIASNFLALPTHHPEIEANSIIILSMRKSDILKISAEKKENVNGMALLATWVWRNRGIASLESACKIASYVARGKRVEAQPAPSPGTLYEYGGQRPRKTLNITYLKFINH